MWSSLAWRTRGQRLEMLAEWPVPCPRNWVALVNAVQTESERGAPFGEERWSKRVAERLGLESSLRPRGRPTKLEK